MFDASWQESQYQFSASFVERRFGRVGETGNSFFCIADGQTVDDQAET